MSSPVANLGKYFINKEITHYTEANFPKIGLYVYKKYLNSQEKFSKQYQRGLAILKNTKKMNYTHVIFFQSLFPKKAFLLL